MRTLRRTRKIRVSPALSCPVLSTRTVTHFIEHYAAALTAVLASVIFGLGAH
jgi:hypothetical protein